MSRTEKVFLHEDDDFRKLCRIIAESRGVPVQLVEKDYWLMHVLWGLKAQGYSFELKGGTSLSKGFGLIHRFSEDIDIFIKPDEDSKLPIGKNQDKPNQIKKRKEYFEGLAYSISIPGIEQVARDHAFDDKAGKFRSAGIRLSYSTFEQPLEGLKHGILLEAGFDRTEPNEKKLISSWAFDFASESGALIFDNRAIDIPCYLPSYTLVEKLQALSTKFRFEQESGTMPENFIRHYYDVYCLLGDASVLEFVGSKEYQEHKISRFPKSDESDLTKNEAFLLREVSTFTRYRNQYDSSTLYEGSKPTFDQVLERIRQYLPKL